MSDALSIALNGLNSTTAQIVKATSSIVNASSTGATEDLSNNLVNILQDKTSYAAEAKVIRAVDQNNKTLLNILV